MLDLQVSRARPEPLYQQLADGIAYAIATGRLEAGATLPSLRDAELHWGVNLHTVRRAYAEVERAGLVRTIPRSGTVVLAESERAPRPADVGSEDSRQDAFVRECLAEAERQFGLTPVGLAERLLELADREPPLVWVGECSRSLGSMLAEQIRSRWRVRAAAFSLGDTPPAGAVISTYFHYNDFRGALEERASDLSFVRIRPSENFFREMDTAVGNGTGDGRVVLLETDRSLAHNVGADLVRRLGPDLRIELRIAGRPTVGDDGVDRIDLDGLDGHVVVVSPQNWDRLDETARSRAGVVPLRYEIDASDLERLGVERNWRRATSGTLPGRTAP